MGTWTQTATGALLPVVLMLSGCRSEAPPQLSDRAVKAGGVSIALAIADATTVDTVNYAITHERSEFAQSGTLPVSADGRAAGTISGLPAASGYRLELTAPRFSGTTAREPCLGEATFSIVDDETTSVAVVMQCDDPSQASGTVVVNGALDHCPRLRSVSATPTVQAVGSQVALSAIATDADGDPLSYEWYLGESFTPGAVFASTQDTSYVCTEAGPRSVNVRVSDDRGCARELRTAMSLECTASGTPSDADLPERLALLASAREIEWWVGDLDADGAPEAILVGRQPTAASVAGQTNTPARGALQALEPGGASLGVVFRGVGGGQFTVVQDNRGLDFSRMRLAATLLADDLNDVLDALITAAGNVAGAGCDLLSLAMDVVANAVVERKLFGDPLNLVLSSLIGAELGCGPLVSSEVVSCLDSPQRPLGCLGIWASSCCGTSTTGTICKWIGSRDHVYYVPRDDPRARTLLCQPSQHESGCCNADFLYEKIFLSDLQNMAPMPYKPSSGAMPLTPETVVLDGLKIPDQWIADAGPPGGILECVINGLMTTRNPIELSVQPNRCGRNKTEPGHVLEGTVTQCLVADRSGVHTEIVGKGIDTRFAGINELIGPYILGKVRERFRDLVLLKLAEADSKGLCCEGAEVHGGSAEIDRRLGQLNLAKGAQRGACDSRCIPMHQRGCLRGNVVWEDSCGASSGEAIAACPEDCIAGYCVPSSGESGEWPYSGTILDCVSGEPLADASISIAGQTSPIRTNASGSFSALLPTGVLTASVQRAGYSAGTFTFANQPGSSQARTPWTLGCEDASSCVGWTFPACTGSRCALGARAHFGVSSGEPHLRTFDGLLYEMQAVGEFVLVQSLDDDFSVQVRTRAVASRRDVSVNGAVVAVAKQDRVGIYLDGPKRVRVLVNAQPLSLSAGFVTLPGGAKLERRGDLHVLTWPDGSALYVWAREQHLDLNVVLASQRYGRVEGLLGNNNDSTADDLVNVYGIPITGNAPFGAFYSLFVTKWRVSDVTSRFDYGPQESTATFADLMFPSEPTSLEQLDGAQRASAEASCRSAGVVDPAWLDACILDVALTGDASFASSLAGAPAVRNAVKLSTATSPCGDGQLDPSEYCDDSTPAACPRSCDDGNPCTIDTMVGTAAQCSARCQYTRISNATNCITCQRLGTSHKCAGQEVCLGPGAYACSNGVTYGYAEGVPSNHQCTLRCTIDGVPVTAAPTCSFPSTFLTTAPSGGCSVESQQCSNYPDCGFPAFVPRFQ